MNRIDTSKHDTINGKFLFTSKKHTVYDAHEIMRDKKPLLVATCDDHVIVQGHVYKYVGEIEDFSTSTDMLI